jgi:hypothetical protein
MGLFYTKARERIERLALTITSHEVTTANTR